MTPEQVEARFQRIEAILAQTAAQNVERDQRIDSLAEQAQLMMIGINNLVESSIEYKRWKVETDQRFNILLEDIRSINRRVATLENQ